MKLINVGDDAPNFTLTDNNDQYVTLTNFRGKKVLLSWHPLAWTPVCTDQMRALEVNYENFQNLNTIPLGFSVDPTPCKKIWAHALQLKMLKILSDFWPHGKTAKEYGIFREQGGYSERANIIIDEHGKVMWLKVYPSAQLPDLNEVFNVLSGS
ncbi:redoxin domain-containing protein [Sporomusa acidovorans]|uniref:Alkyl hydroperoxide reductase E n=1 Tax=Sporomusa acidovorans (strain ATCC 49682 / DSM 3132 / Mol) TaxID=1123286 RepID=A0ABZ3J309_SPOA4|nr:redoxin domain-containing protein [Sporomusa acidovorans]OZC19948.1 putative peroxiredoxinc [Sporomusa acidovorans DSM 3132]SDD49253.1 Peroxiredoxin [Sporomusa acidovorans]